MTDLVRLIQIAEARAEREAFRLGAINAERWSLKSRRLDVQTRLRATLTDPTALLMEATARRAAAAVLQTLDAQIVAAERRRSIQARVAAVEHARAGLLCEMQKAADRTKQKAETKQRLADLLSHNVRDQNVADILSDNPVRGLE